MRILRILALSLVAALGLGANFAAASPVLGANLLENGDFEVVDGRVGFVRNHALDALDSGRWDVYETLPGGWYTSSGAGIEVEYSGTVVPAFSGNHYVELDSHPHGSSNSAASIDILLDAGAYQLDFAYRPRTTVAGDNGIHVRLDDLVLTSLDGVRTGSTQWEVVSLGLEVAQSGLHTLTFEAFGIENTLGGFIDDVSLRAVTSAAPVPEPGAALVFMSGLAVVSRSLRRRNLVAAD